jgi:hypothetical protein
LRALLENESTENVGNFGAKSMVQKLPPEGIHPSQVTLPRSTEQATTLLLVRLYLSVYMRRPKRTLNMDKRDVEIQQLWQQGVHPNDIALRFNITPERIYQIIKRVSN